MQVVYLLYLGPHHLFTYCIPLHNTVRLPSFTLLFTHTHFHYTLLYCVPQLPQVMQFLYHLLLVLIITIILVLALPLYPHPLL
jgi:hypothetical protein